MKYPKIGFKGNPRLAMSENLQHRLISLLRAYHLVCTYNFNSSSNYYVIDPDYQQIRMYEIPPVDAEIVSYSLFAEKLVEFCREVEAFYQSLKIGDTVVVEPSRFDGTYYPFMAHGQNGSIGKIVDILPDATSPDDKKRRFYNGDNRAYFVDSIGCYVSSTCFQMAPAISVPLIALEDLNIII